MNPQLIADLEAARALIDTPEKWLKGAIYTDGFGKTARVGVAVCFCADGAIDRACYSESDGCINHDRARAVLRSLGFTECTRLWDWNDAPERTHAEVLELFDKAIANERRKA